jgi:phosphate-selective porin OprO/OprP
LVAGAGQLNIDRNAFRDSTGNFGGSDSFASPTSAASQAQNYTVGVNWYLNNVLRLSLDYSNTAFDGGGGGTAAAPDDLDNERVLTGRVQASF